MLHITVVLEESINEETNEFIVDRSFELQLEHSLVSLSKWESHFEKPFLSKNDKTPEEMLWYVSAMILTPNVPPEVFAKVHNNFDEITAYVESKQTALHFPDKKAANNQSITAEQIYYWMIAYQVPFECQNWHLNRLLALIRVCNEKNTPSKPMSKAELAQRNRELNERRKAELNTRG